MMTDEPLDRNKTDATHAVTACAAAYFDRMGCKPIETEVATSQGWIADLATFIYPSPSKYEQMKLTDFALPVDKYGIVRASARGIERVRVQELEFFFGQPLTIVVEVKTSRGDFLSSVRDGRFERHPAHLCYLATGPGVTTEEEVRSSCMGWWWIQVASTYGQIRKVHQPTVTRDIRGFARHVMGLQVIHPQHPGDVTDLIARIAIRRDHRTRYGGMRAWLKHFRAQEGASDGS